MISSRPFDASEPDSLDLWALHNSISRAVARPRRRIDFSRFNSSRLEKPFESFAGGLLSVDVAMKPSLGCQAVSKRKRPELPRRLGSDTCWRPSGGVCLRNRRERGRTEIM